MLKVKTKTQKNEDDRRQSSFILFAAGRESSDPALQLLHNPLLSAGNGDTIYLLYISILYVTVNSWTVAETLLSLLFPWQDYKLLVFNQPLGKQLMQSSTKLRLCTMRTVRARSLDIRFLFQKSYSANSNAQSCFFYVRWFLSNSSRD